MKRLWPACFILLFLCGCTFAPEKPDAPIQVQHLIDPDNHHPIWTFRAGQPSASSRRKTPMKKRLRADTGDGNSIVRVNCGGIWRRAFVLAEDKSISVKYGQHNNGTLRFWTTWSPSIDSAVKASPQLTIRIATGETHTEHRVTLAANRNRWHKIDLPLNAVETPGTVTFCAHSGDARSDFDDTAVLVGSPVIISGSQLTTPHVIWIVVDSLRARDVGIYGSPAATTPIMDAFSRDAVTFLRAQSTSSWTMPAVKNFMTGRYTNRFAREGEDLYLIKPRVPVIQSNFAHRGWMTAAVTANHLVNPDSGFDRGFGVFDEAPSHDWRHGSTESLYHRTSALLEEYRGMPLFLYVHVMDPHDPYTPVHPFHKMYDPPSDTMVRKVLHSRESGYLNQNYFKDNDPLTATEKAYLHRNYLGEIRQVDTFLHLLLRRLADLELLDSSIVIITADHGEEFGEHGYYQHSKSLYEEAVHVPLILTFPGLETPGALMTQWVTTLDIPETLSDIAGLVFPEDPESCSLHPSDGYIPEDRAVFSILHHRERRNSAHSLWRSVYRNGRKIMWINHEGYCCTNLNRFPNESYYTNAVNYRDFSKDDSLKSWKSLAAELKRFMDSETVFSDAEPDDYGMLQQKLIQLGYME